MDQLSFGSLDFATKKKRTKREVFLAEMAAVVPWGMLEALIEPHYPKMGPQGGRRPFPLPVMLRIYCLQQWYTLSDPGAEEALYDIQSMRAFCGLELGRDAIPDETTILNFRHLLERTLHGHRMSGSVIPGHLAILPPDAGTRWIFDKTGDIVLVYVSRSLFDEAVEDGIDRDPRLVEIMPRFLIRDLVLERVAHKLLREIAERRPDSRLAAEVLAQELVGHLIGAHSNLAVLPRRSAHAMAPSRLKRAREFMHANLARPLSLRDLADAAGMSVFHFARGFKQATGVPPHQYLTEQRLAEARTLLHNSDPSIGEVARAVGFTHSHFTALFAKRMGMTPTRFREVLLS